MNLGRFVIAAPWGNDTGVSDKCLALQEQHGLKVEFWFAESLNRLISPYVAITHRHFGTKIAFDAESFLGNKLSVIYKQGPIPYLGLTEALAEAEHWQTEKLFSTAAAKYENIAFTLAEHGLFGESARLLDKAAICHQKAGKHKEAARVRLSEASRLFGSGRFLEAQLGAFQIEANLPGNDPQRKLWEVYELLADSLDFFLIDATHLESALTFLRTQTPEPNSQTLLLSLGELALLIHDEDAANAIAKVINLHTFVGTNDEGRAEAFLIDSGERSWSPSDVDSYRSDTSKVIAWMRQGARLARSIDIGSAMVDVATCKGAFEQARLLAFENRMFTLAYDAQRSIANASASSGVFEDFEELERLSQGVNTISHHSRSSGHAHLAEDAAVEVVAVPRSAFSRPIQKCAKAASDALSQGCLAAKEDALRVLVGIARKEGNREVADYALVLAGQKAPTEAKSEDPSLRAVALVRRGKPLRVRVAAADYIATVGKLLPDVTAEGILDDVIQLAAPDTVFGRKHWVAGRAAVASIAGSIISAASREKIVSLLKDHAPHIAQNDGRAFTELCRWTYRWCDSPAEILDVDCWLLGFAHACPQHLNIAEDVFLFRLNHFGGAPKEVLGALGCITPTGFAANIVHPSDEPSAAAEIVRLIRGFARTKASLPPIRGRTAKLLPAGEQVKAIAALLFELKTEPDPERLMKPLSSLLAITGALEEVSTQIGSKIARGLKSLPGDALERHKNLIEPLRCNFVSIESVESVTGDLLARLFSDDSKDHGIAAGCLQGLWRRKIDFLSPQNLMQHQSAAIRELALHELVIRGTAPKLSQGEELSIRLFAAKHRSHFPDFDFDLDPHSLVRFTANDSASQCNNPLHETKRRSKAKAKVT
jgi:hypothetical protein